MFSLEAVNIRIRQLNPIVEVLFYFGAPLGIFLFVNGMPTLVDSYKIITYLLVFVTMGTHFIFRSKKNLVGIRITGGILFYGFLLTALVFIVYYLTKFVVLTDQYGFEEMLKMYEDQAKLIFFAICYLQPIILPLPEAVTVIAGSAIMGAFPAFILAFIGAVLGIITMYHLTKYLGERFILRFVNGELLDKYHTYVRKSETLILFVLFIIPILPDEIICVGAGLSGVRPRKFITLAIFGKLVTAFTLAYSIRIAEISGLSPTAFLVSLGVILAIVYIIVKGFGYLRRGKE